MLELVFAPANSSASALRRRTKPATTCPPACTQSPNCAAAPSKSPRFTFCNSVDFMRLPRPALKQKSTSASNWLCDIASVTSRFTHRTALSRSARRRLSASASVIVSPARTSAPVLSVSNRPHPRDILIRRQPQPFKRLRHRKSRIAIFESLHPPRPPQSAISPELNRRARPPHPSAVLAHRIPLGVPPA
jgi:hypothetical protein